MKFIPAIILATFIITGCNNHADTKITETRSVPDTVSAFSLKTQEVEKQVSLPGELLPYERVEIRPKITGYVKHLKVDIGSAVKKGQIIVVVDAPEIKSKLGEGASQMNASKANYQTSLDTYNRIREASNAKGVISPNELQRAKNQMLADSAAYEAARFTSESYKELGDYLAITAPFDGVITQRNVNEGAYVGNANEKPIVVIEDNSKLRLRIAVPETLTGAHLKENQVIFTTKAYPNKQYHARLMRKAGSIDVDTRTEIWEFEVPNGGNVLKPGSFANAMLRFSRAEPSFAVPYSAIVTTHERKFVIKVTNDSTRWIDVSAGLNFPDKTEIFGTLHEGDTLVLKASEELKPGVKVFAKL